MQENISIADILKICLKKWKFIAVVTVLCAVTSYLISSFMMIPMYKSVGQINTKNSSFATEAVDNVTVGAINAAEKLGATFIEMLKNDTFLSKVKNMGNFSLSTSEIRNMLVFDQPDDTGIINIRVNAKDPKLAYMLVQEILRHAPSYLEGEMQGTTVDVLQEARFETVPYAPNTARNVVLGILLGIVFGVIGSLCLEFFNKKIETSEEIEESFGMPILGEIPNLRGGRGSGVY